MHQQCRPSCFSLHNTSRQLGRLLHYLHTFLLDPPSFSPVCTAAGSLGSLLSTALLDAPLHASTTHATLLCGTAPEAALARGCIFHRLFCGPRDSAIDGLPGWPLSLPTGAAVGRTDSLQFCALTLPRLAFACKISILILSHTVHFWVAHHNYFSAHYTGLNKGAPLPHQ